MPLYLPTTFNVSYCASKTIRGFYFIRCKCVWFQDFFHMWPRHLLIASLFQAREPFNCFNPSHTKYPSNWCPSLLKRLSTLSALKRNQRISFKGFLFSEATRSKWKYLPGQEFTKFVFDMTPSINREALPWLLFCSFLLMSAYVFKCSKNQLQYTQHRIFLP